MIRVADYIMNRLYEAGVKHVFQVTGRGALFLNDALAKHKDLNAISLHHEQSCAFAASSYAEKTHGLGACLVSSGCASTNTLTGVLSAWQDGVPCIFISGQNTLNETSRYTGIALRTYGQQEADIVSLVSPITKFASMITKPEEIVETMNIALLNALSGRKGPVWLDIPLDLQSSLIEPDQIISSSNEFKVAASNKEVIQVIDALSTSKRPVVLIGRGVSRSDAEVKLKGFIETWKLPLTFSASAPDTYGSSNELSIGSVGAMGCSRAGNFAIANADLVLVLGSRLNSLTTGTDFCKFAREARIIVVDIDPVEHSKGTIHIDQFIESDIACFLDKIAVHKVKVSESAWIEKCKHWKHIFMDVESNFKSSFDLIAEK